MPAVTVARVGILNINTFAKLYNEIMVRMRSLSMEWQFMIIQQSFPHSVLLTYRNKDVVCIMNIIVFSVLIIIL